MRRNQRLRYVLAVLTGIIVGCYAAPSPVPSFTVNWKSLKLASYLPAEATVQGDLITIKQEFKPGSFGVRIFRYYSDDIINIEDPAVAFTIGITNPSLFTLGNMESAFPAVFSVVIANKLNEPVTINWDNVAYIDDSKVSHKVVKSGTRIVERDRPTGNIVIPPGAKIEEMMHPVDAIYYGRTTWVTTSILEHTQEGSKVGIFIPIEIKGQVINYSFTFEVQAPKE